MLGSLKTRCKGWRGTEMFMMKFSRGARNVSPRTLREGRMGKGGTCPYFPFPLTLSPLPQPVTGTKVVKVYPEVLKKKLIDLLLVGSNEVCGKIGRRRYNPLSSDMNWGGGGGGDDVWKAGPRPDCAPTLVSNSLGSDCLPGLIRSPLGLPQTVYHCGWGGLLAGFRRRRKHGATLGSTAESGKTIGVGLHTLSLRSHSSGPSLIHKAGPTPSLLGPSLPKSVAPFLPNPSPTLRPPP